MAEGNGLLNRHRVKSSIEGSNPSLSAMVFQRVRPGIHQGAPTNVGANPSLRIFLQNILQR